MKIYTSYIGNVRNVVAAHIVPITIVQYPKEFHDWIENLPELSPSKKYWGKSHEVFEIMFREQHLNHIDARKTYAALKYLGQGKDVALLCFESLKKEGQFCHRTTVAKWLMDELGIKIEEFGAPKPETQTNLFGGKDESS